MKNKLIILVLAIILLVVILILTNKAKPVEIDNPNNNVENYQTQSIEEEINSINVDAEIDEDMKSIDADLENL